MTTPYYSIRFTEENTPDFLSEIYGNNVFEYINIFFEKPTDAQSRVYKN